MTWCVIVGLLAVVQYIWFGVGVGRERGRSGVKAPAMTGDEGLERALRVQYNTLEQLVAFLPGLFAAGWYVHGPGAAGVGVVFLVGRALYARAYMRDPASRGLGFGLTFLAVVLLVLGGLGGAAWTLVPG